jgi:hypothetical protein
MRSKLVTGLLVVLALAASVIAYNTAQSNRREQKVVDSITAAARQAVVEQCRTDFWRNNAPHHQRVQRVTLGSLRPTKGEARCAALGVK